MEKSILGKDSYNGTGTLWWLTEEEKRIVKEEYKKRKHHVFAFSRRKK